MVRASLALLPVQRVYGNNGKYIYLCTSPRHAAKGVKK